MEKAVKGLVASMNDAGMLNCAIGYMHEVERFMAVLVKPSVSGPRGEIQRRINNLLDARRRGEIRALEALTPRRPARSALPARNTEYPFSPTKGQWVAPTDTGVFNAAEIGRFRRLAHEIVDGCSRIVSAVQRVERPGE